MDDYDISKFDRNEDGSYRAFRVRPTGEKAFMILSNLDQLEEFTEEHDGGWVVELVSYSRVELEEMPEFDGW